MWLSFLFCRFHIILVVFILAQIFNVLSDDEIFTEYNLTVSTSPYIQNNGDDFNVTTMYKMLNPSTKDKTGGGFKDVDFRSIYYGNYSIEVYPKTNSIGLIPSITNLKDKLYEIISPSNKSDNNLFKNSTFIKVYASSHWIYNNITTSGYYCDAGDNHADTPGGNTADCFDAFDYNRKEVVHVRSSKKNIIFTIDWQPQNHLNSLRIIYIFKKNMYFDIEMNILDTNNKVLYTSLLNTSRNITQLIIKSTRSDDDVKYKIIFSKKSNAYHTNIDYMTPFSIFQIANYFQTSYSGYESKIIPGLLPKNRRLSPHNLFSSSSDDKKYMTTHNSTDSSASNCLNGGYRLKDRCVCPPGFRGVLCEEGCGPNTFGADCSGLCSVFTTNGCRGIYFCTISGGCTCSTGLTGRFCDEDCPSNTYGANCNQNCSSECIDKICDQYTGICTHGRLEGDKSPYSTDKIVAYLRSPPKLISADHETITVEIDCDSENIVGNNGYTLVKYYQLIWKDSYKNTYSSKIKPLNSNKFKETISGLKPGSVYNVGVLIIINDGNFNEKDIVYGLYKTICLENPNINEYNYQVIAGLRSINITWDKVSVSKQQCPIIELSLTLSMINYELQNITHTFNIIPNSNHNYVIRDLVPGYEYSVNLTPRTSLGVLTPSHTFKVKPKFTDKDVTIKNITAKYIDQNKSISISWKPVINVCGLNSDIVDTFIVKYKINRIFSCSSKEIEEDWTSITINNSTDYEIKNVIPNSQYMIQVFMDSEDKKTTQKENIVYVLTPPSTPSLIPILEQPLEVTENSTIVKWKSENSNCSSINGIFKNFVVVLKNINDKTKQIIKTEDNNITFNDLKPMNTYELKIFVENNIGYSSEHFLLISVNTSKNESLSDLVVYKMNLKKHTLGLRWSYPVDKTPEQFIISIGNNEPEKCLIEIPTNPEFCSAWPKYYCKEVNYKCSENNFSIKVKAKFSENKEGGETTITFNNKNKIPDSPQNLKMTNTDKTNVTLQWDIPWIFNGELKSFIVYVEELKSMNNTLCCELTVPHEIPYKEELQTYNHLLKDLKPNFVYSIFVVSRTTTAVNSLPSNFIEVTTEN